MTVERERALLKYRLPPAETAYDIVLKGVVWRYRLARVNILVLRTNIVRTAVSGMHFIHPLAFYYGGFWGPRNLLTSWFKQYRPKFVKHPMSTPWFVETLKLAHVLYKPLPFFFSRHKCFLHLKNIHPRSKLSG